MPLNSGLAVSDITFIDGTVYKTRKREDIYDAIELPHYEEVLADKAAYARSFIPSTAIPIRLSPNVCFETYDGKLFVVQNPPAKPLTQKRDGSGLCAAVSAHVSSELRSAGRGSCNRGSAFFSGQQTAAATEGMQFCALTFHQGRIIQVRSHESILAEAEKIVWEPDFKGYIHDVGGPTANFRAPAWTSR